MNTNSIEPHFTPVDESALLSARNRRPLLWGLFLLIGAVVLFTGINGYRNHTRDQKILKIAHEKIDHLSVLDSGDSIRVKVKRGTLVVTGHIHSRNKAAHLDSMLKTISQVRHLKNQVQLIHPPNIDKLNVESTEIADQIPILLEKARRGFLTSAELERIINRMTIFFEPNVAAVTRVKEFELLNGLVQIMAAFPETRLTITGYADDGFDLYYNKRLSKNRAKFVANHLVSKGISSDRLSIEFIGDPVSQIPVANSRDKWRNRRTEFKITLAG